MKNYHIAILVTSIFMSCSPEKDIKPNSNKARISGTVVEKSSQSFNAGELGHIMAYFNDSLETTVYLCSDFTIENPEYYKYLSKTSEALNTQALELTNPGSFWILPKYSTYTYSEIKPYILDSIKTNKIGYYEISVEEGNYKVLAKSTDGGLMCTTEKDGESRTIKNCDLFQAKNDQLITKDFIVDSRY
jgi:hypothetical protein